MADIHNSSEIRPEWQQRRVGDAIPAWRTDVLGGAMVDPVLLHVVGLEPERMMITADGGNMGYRSGTIIRPGERRR